MKLLLENDFIQVLEHPDEKVIRVVRSDQRGDPPELLEAYRAGLGALRPEHALWGVLIDVRKAPGRSDDSFERSIEMLRGELSAHVARVVLLVSTAVGKLQAGRVAREAGRAPSVTQDEAEAMRWAARGD